MRAAGVRRFGDPVELLDLPQPRTLRPDEVLIDVQAAGVGNWDEFVRTGSWNLGIGPPMALGVEAAGLVAAVGDQVTGFRPGDRVTTHAVPLREQGAWAEWFVAAAEHIAAVPDGVPFGMAAALPVPALTADQVIGAALEIRAGQTVLVNGAGGVTGGMLVQLAAYREAVVIATAGPDSAGRVRAMGAGTVIDYHQAGWAEQVRALTGGGVDAAANAARSGSGVAVRAVRDGGKLATITADLPAVERGIAMWSVQVVPDGRRLGALVELLARDVLAVRVSRQFALGQAGAALTRARHGGSGSAVVLRPGPPMTR